MTADCLGTEATSDYFYDVFYIYNNLGTTKSLQLHADYSAAGMGLVTYNSTFNAIDPTTNCHEWGREYDTNKYVFGKGMSQGHLLAVVLTGTNPGYTSGNYTVSFSSTGFPEYYDGYFHNNYNYIGYLTVDQQYPGTVTASTSTLKVGYITAPTPDREARAYIAFDIPVDYKPTGIKKIFRAQIRLNVAGYVSPDGTENLQLFKGNDSTTSSSIIAETTGLATAHTDLGSGLMYGSHVLDKTATYPQSVIININQAIPDIESAANAGIPFLIGFRLENTGITDNEYVDIRATARTNLELSVANK